MNDTVNPEAFDTVLRKIDDGNLFERFSQDLLCQILGKEFLPAGRIHDRGIDGLEHCFEDTVSKKTIYQASISKDPLPKIRESLKKLRINSIECSRFFYVTNQHVPDKDVIEEQMYNEFEIVAKIKDRAWLRGNVNKNSGTIKIYYSFLDSHYHEFSEPGKSFRLTNLEGDPRVFVFLRQQWEEHRKDHKLDEVLVDSLIIFSLEGTNPEKTIFLTKDQISAKITELAKE